MNTKNTQSNWSDTKAKIQAKWSKFSDAQLEPFKENLDQLVLSVQKLYGITKEKAETEFKEFTASLYSAQSIKTTQPLETAEAVKNLEPVKALDKEITPPYMKEKAAVASVNKTA